MLAALSRHQPLRILFGRAVVLFVLSTVVVLAFKLDSPAAAALLVPALGWVDIRRRHESIFWANLGYSIWQIVGVFATVAVLCETLVALVLHPLIQGVLATAR